MTDNCENVETDIPAFRVAFGVGSWDFGLRYDGPVPFSLDMEQYITRLKAGLEADPSLNNLEILPWPGGEQFIFTQWNLRETDTGPAIFPGRSLSLYRIKFDLHIPRRYHGELTEPFPTRFKTENVRIHVHYPFVPVCFVELVDTDTSSDPSQAIVVARRYMERWLNKPSNDVVFTSIGPSPFHADFYLEGYKTPNNTDRTFECQILDSRGYANVSFRCCTEQYKTAAEASRELFHALNDELDFFYEVKRLGSERYQKWDEVRQLASNVIERFKTTGWAQFLHALTRGGNVAALRVSLVEFEEENLWNDQRLNEAYRRLYGGEMVTFLKSFADTALKNRFMFATKQLIDLIEFIERRRSKSIELLIILFAALVGGVAGSIITSITQ